MTKHNILFTLLFPLLTFSQQNIPFQAGESCTYRIHYGLITAAYGTLSVETAPENPKQFFFKGIGKTIDFFNYIFEVDDKYISYAEKETLLPKHFIRHINEGGYTMDQEYFFHHQKEEVVSKGKSYKILEKTQDMLSAFYYFRSILVYHDVKKDPIIKVNIFLDEEMYPMRVKYLRNEWVDTKWGKINCLVFVPQLQIGRIFKEEEEMRIWISDDENKIMVKVETDILIGSIKADLVEYKGLKRSLSIKQ